jgi:hypothetical protein
VGEDNDAARSVRNRQKALESEGQNLDVLGARNVGHWAILNANHKPKAGDFFCQTGQLGSIDEDTQIFVGARKKPGAALGDRHRSL